MTKTQDAMAETINDPKHPFHQVDSMPSKSQKHRYERRKVKQILHSDLMNIDDDEASSPPQ